MSRTNFKELLQAGVHFGHLKKKYNPAMAPYIFMEQNGIHIIDLNKKLLFTCRETTLEIQNSLQSPFLSSFNNS